jgi:hypothetical protein
MSLDLFSAGRPSEWRSRLSVFLMHTKTQKHSAKHIHQLDLVRGLFYNEHSG